MARNTLRARNVSIDVWYQIFKGIKFDIYPGLAEYFASTQSLLTICGWLIWLPFHFRNLGNFTDRKKLPVNSKGCIVT